jgi:hypothetical protein
VEAKGRPTGTATVNSGTGPRRMVAPCAIADLGQAAAEQKKPVSAPLDRHWPKRLPEWRGMLDSWTRPGRSGGDWAGGLVAPRR